MHGLAKASIIECRVAVNVLTVLLLTCGQATYAQNSFEPEVRAQQDYAISNVVMRHYDAALDIYSIVIRTDPNNDQAYSDRCRLRAIIGRELERALADCNRVLRLNPNNIEVFDNRGLTFLKLGEYRRAIADYNTLLRHQPNKASALYGRGVAKRKNGDLAGAEIDIAAAKHVQLSIAEEFAVNGVR